MPVNAIWDNDSRTIMRYEFVDIWTWQELRQAVTQGHAMIEEVEHIVDAIVDFRLSAGIPSNAIAQTRSLIASRHPRTGGSIFVGATPLFRNLWAMVMQVYAVVIRQKGAVFVFADSMDDARAMLAKKESRG